MSGMMHDDSHVQQTSGSCPGVAMRSHGTAESRGGRAAALHGWKTGHILAISNTLSCQNNHLHLRKTQLDNKPA